MNKGIKLFGQSKETKELERNPVNLRRVRDFVARYSDPDELAFPGSEQHKKPASEAQTFSFATEKHGEGQAKKTRRKGNTLSLTRSRVSTTLTQTNRPLDSALSDSFPNEFPLIELPTTNDDEDGESFATAPTTEQSFITTENSSVTFASPLAAPVEEFEHEAKLPLIQPIELDTQEERVVSAEDALPRASKADAAFGVTGRRTRLTIIDNVAAETEKPRGMQTSPLHEKSLPTTRRRDTELTLAQAPTNGEAPQIKPVVAKGERQEKSGKSSQKKIIFSLQRTKRRRVKQTHVHIGRRKVLATENTGEPEVLCRRGENEAPDLSFSEPPGGDLERTDYGFSVDQGAPSEERARPDRRKQATALKIDSPRSSVTPKDVERPLAVQRELDNLDPCLVSFLAPDSFEAEQYRVLRHLVERLRGERGRSCIVAVSSPSAGDGKTTTALNLAGALAQAADARVLLIDADLRRPSVLERLGGQSAANRGLVKAVLHPRLRLQNTTIQYAFLNLTILPAGQPTSSSYEIFKSPRFGVLLEEAQRDYDYIILDTPPLVPIPDCRLIAQWVDGFFVVVAAHKTSRKLVQEALTVIPDEKILGLVFNGDDPPVFGYEQYYGYSPLRATENNNTESLS